MDDVQQALKCVPAAGLVDKPPIFHLGPRVQIGPGRFRLTKMPLGQKPAGQRAESQERDTMGPAKGRHAVGAGTLVQKRKTDLIGKAEEKIQIDGFILLLETLFIRKFY